MLNLCKSIKMIQMGLHNKEGDFENMNSEL